MHIIKLTWFFFLFKASVIARLCSLKNCTHFPPSPSHSHRTVRPRISPSVVRDVLLAGASPPPRAASQRIAFHYTIAKVVITASQSIAFHCCIRKLSWLCHKIYMSLLHQKAVITVSQSTACHCCIRKLSLLCHKVQHVTAASESCHYCVKSYRMSLVHQ